MTVAKRLRRGNSRSVGTRANCPIHVEPVHFGSAALFWWVLIHGRYGRLGYGLAVLYVFTTSVHSGVLGALLTFAPSLWYPIYEERAAQWGLSALEDQQLAGLFMWVPAGVIFIFLGLALFAAWLGAAGGAHPH